MSTLQRKKPERSAEGKTLKYYNAKDTLARDFNNRCGYCDDSHRYTGGKSSFHIDHFAPKSKFEEVKDDYQYFVYSCPYCNRAKSDTWIGATLQENVIGNTGFIDPCDEEYVKNFKRISSGRIVPTTDLGMYMYKELKLYLKRHEILYMLDKVYNRCCLLEEKINNDKKLGKNVDDIDSFYNELCRTFFSYYRQYADYMDSPKENIA